MKEKKLVLMISSFIIILGTLALLTGCSQLNDGKSQTIAEYIGSYEGGSSGKVSGL